MVGRTIPEVYPGIEHTPLFAAMRRCLQDGAPANPESEFVYRDGGTGWFELRLQPVPEGLFVMSVDVTERKRAQQELARRQADEKFRGLLAAAPDAIVVVNADGRILYANAQTEKLFGYERKSLGGASLERLISERRQMEQALREKNLALALGAARFVPWPIEPDYLLREVEACLKWPPS
jgi:PAS domain-containing protein